MKQSNKKTKGLVLGKFLPPHKGHQYLIDYAQNYVDDLYIVVDNIFNDVIDVSTRMDWMRNICPSAQILTLKKELPQYPEEAPTDFWEQWEQGLKDILKDEIDFVFASEEYGEKLASVLNAKFVMVDLDRKIVPISASKIRENPYKNWEYIADAAKPYYCKKVCIFGPESVGKSTLTVNLAKHYNTSFVPEYAREIIENCNGQIEYKHIEEIAVGHSSAIQKEIRNANKLLFVDTDAITTKIWSKELFCKYPPVLDEIISKLDYDLYLLLDVDVPWVDDIVRYRPNNREEFFAKCKNELISLNKNFIVISGSWNDRFNKAIYEVNKLIGF